MLQPDMESIFTKIIKIIKIKCFVPPRILEEHWCIYFCSQIPPRENWFQYVHRVFIATINYPCISTLREMEICSGGNTQFWFNTNYSTREIIINTQDTNYSTRGIIIKTQDTNYSTWEIIINAQDTNYSIGRMVINTQNTNYFIGVMVINTQDTNYSSWGMIINTQDTNYSIRGMVINT